MSRYYYVDKIKKSRVFEKIYKTRFGKMLDISFNEFKNPYYQGFAAALSFYFLLSIVPIILIVTQFLTLIFRNDIESLIDILAQYMGKDMSEIVGALVSGRGSGTFSFIFLIVALWSASKAQFSMSRVANFIITRGRATGSNFIKDRLLATRSIFITILTIIFSLVVMVYGELIVRLIFGIIGIDINVAKLWLLLRWPVAILLYFFMISYNYYFMTNIKLRYWQIVPGSIVAAVGFLIVTLGYAYYMSNFANYNLLYGSISSIIALLMWFYLLAWVLALGVMFNRAWWDTNDDGYIIDKKIEEQMNIKGFANANR